MSISQTKNRIAIPKSLVGQLSEFRERVWTTKMLEASGIALFSIFFGVLCVFALDRVFDSPAWIRAAVLLLATIGVASVPFWFQKWVIRIRSAESVAKLLSKKMPAVGDSLLGAIELSNSDSEQRRSPELCKAALNQVAEDSAKRNLLAAIPTSRHRIWGSLAATGLAVLSGLWILYPLAIANAWARFTAPLGNIQRYTFAAIEPLPEKVVVPHGEAFPISVKLAAGSEWSPAKATATIGDQAGLESQLVDRQYAFEFPPQIEAGTVSISIGDASPHVLIEPKLRPELERIQANVELPKYLQRDQHLTKDVRGGGLSVVRGASVGFDATASRSLVSAKFNGGDIAVQDQSFAPKQEVMEESRKIEFDWTDSYGLSAKSPFTVNITVRNDEAPAVFSDGLPRSRVLLDSEQLQFTVRSVDDFGVKHLGMEWRTAEGFKGTESTQGELMLTAGSPTSETLDAMATFQATALKIPAQPLELRMFVEDYLPDRGRVYSTSHLLYVLTPSDHAIWVLDQLSRWQRESLEVRDRELQLLDTNRKIRDLSEEALNQEDTRRKIEQQASAEQANGRKLKNLTGRGEELLRQAARNSEIGVGHLEKWAEMHQILKDIAANRMPSVADLLKRAKDEKKIVKSNSGQAKTGPTVGQSKDSASNPGGEQKTDPQAPKPQNPSIADRESSQQPAIPAEDANQTAKKAGAPPPLRLPQTTVMGKPQPKKPGEEDESPPNEENKVEEAVRKQEELLAEFDKVAEELNNLMANLEGSTLVKRLKAASREQMQIADATSGEIDDAFGSSLKRLKSEQQTRIKTLKTREENALNNVGLIIDDLEAFNERRPLVKFQSVLDEMKKDDVLGGIRVLSNRILESQGIAIAEAEYWSDTMDRWAEDLVDPACKGECKGGKSKSSLPPSIILEVMKILEEEINLRERTRVAEQAKPVSDNEKYLDLVDELATTQISLQERICAVRIRIEELPDAENEFGKEIALMNEVDRAMIDAAEILDRPDTSKLAIAAETEVIELLLKSKRINPKSGGGGGADPGGGGGGDTQDAAIALLGAGINEKEIREDHGVQQSTGTAGSTFPEEYRQGLDEYFQRLERKALP